MESLLKDKLFNFRVIRRQKYIQERIGKKETANKDYERPAAVPWESVWTVGKPPLLLVATAGAMAVLRIVGLFFYIL